MTGVFDWCRRSHTHSGCKRSYTPHDGKHKGTTVYCQCDKRSCPCSKNPRLEGVQDAAAVV